MATFRRSFLAMALLPAAFVGTGCSSFAPPGPLFTYGGPETSGQRTSEVAAGVGSGVALFENAHSGGSGWFGRYKYGLSERVDVGVDFMGITRSDEGTIGFKVATRYAMSPRLRGELGLGAADDSDGKSLFADVGLTLGTRRPEPWNFYSTLRLAGAKGFAGNAIFGSDTPQEEDTIAPPDTFFGLINLGAEGEVSDRQSFVIESGIGVISPEHERAAAAFYFSVGVLFRIDRDPREP